MTNDDETRVLLEAIEDKLSRFAEAMVDVPHDVQRLTADVSDLRSDVQVIKTAVQNHSRILATHEHRTTDLERTVGHHGKVLRRLDQPAA